jgi:hypothetical protein
MEFMSPTVLIVYPQDGAAVGYAVKAFSGVPAVVPCLIVLDCGRGGEAAKRTSVLLKELEDVLLGSGPSVTVSQEPAVVDPTRLPVFQETAGQKLLVLVYDAQPFALPSWLAAWLSKDAVVLPVFPKGSDPFQSLPVSLQAINAKFWSDEITECTSNILAGVGLTLAEQRIFLSYRRLETQPLAEQLFDALTHEGFDVFLDRFTIEPGVNFQQRLTQELVDKSMVLLLESAQVETSQWTEHEIQFAKRRQLGLLAVQMPDRPEPLASIDVDLRIQLAQVDFLAPPTLVAAPQNPALPFSQWGRLKDDKLKEVILRAQATHDRAAFRRRRNLRTNAEASLRKAGLIPSPIPDSGLMTVNNSSPYALWLTTRPPELSDFHYTHARVPVTNPKTKGVVIGPTADLETMRRDRLAWLSGLCQFACLDEDDLPEAAELMKKGQL